MKTSCLRLKLVELNFFASFNADDQRKTYISNVPKCKIRCSKIEPGDHVLVRRKGFTGKHKIADHWELQPYQVISQCEVDISVFLVESCGKDGKQRTPHWNMFFPLNVTIESDHERNFDETDGVIETADPQQLAEASDGESLEEEPTYQGPMTQSHMEALMKANLVMMLHFGDDYNFELKDEWWDICKLCHSVISAFRCMIHRQNNNMTFFKTIKSLLMRTQIN